MNHRASSKRAQPPGARFPMPRGLARGLAGMALISVLLPLGAAVGQARSGRGHEPRASTERDRVSVDRELAAAAREIDRASVGETGVATYLGAEFGMSPEAILAERRDLQVSWGNLTVAHTLSASDREGMTAAQVLLLHDRGMGWGQIAAGLRFKLADAVLAVNAESRVARGRAPADGKTAPIGADGF
jgi:hypothetical protein